MKTAKKLLSILLICILSITSVPMAYASTNTETDEIKVGDVIEFGSYPKNEVTDASFSGKTVVLNDKTYSVEAIEWVILKVQDGKALMLSKEIIDGKRFNPANASNYNNYAKSELRTWLVNDFYNTAFSDTEKNMLYSTTLESTSDDVFILSKDEANSYAKKYFSATATDYAYGNGFVAQSSTEMCNHWWTRTAHSQSYSVYAVQIRWGTWTVYYNWYDDTLMHPKGIRPAVYVDVEALAEYEWEPEGLTTEETSTIDIGTFYGVYENPKWTVIFDSESFVSEVTIGKDAFFVNKEFSLKQDFIANENKYLNKEVVVAVRNGEIVNLQLLDDIKAKVELNCTLKLSEQELNYVDKKYSSDKIAVEVYAYVPQLSASFIDYETIKDVPGLSITVNEISLKSSNPDILTFDEKEQLVVDISPKQVAIGNSVYLGTYYADVNTKHKIPDNLSNEIVSITAEVRGQKNGETTKDDVSYGINIKNITSEKPSTENPSTDNQENTVDSKKIKEAAKALRRFMKNVTIVWGTDRIFGNELYDMFTEKELERVAAELFYLLVSSEPIKKSFSDRIFEKILGFNSDWFSIYSNSVSITETKQTNDYGIVKVKFTCDFNELTWGVYNGTISYEMYGENLPQGKRDAAYFVQADTEQFAEKIEEVANDMRPSILDVLSGASDDAFSVLYNKTFNEIIIEAGYSDVSDVALEYISKIKKNLKIDCPVNVYVYDSNDELLACVENNVVVLSTDKAKVQIEGDSKIIWLEDDTYRIEYESLASYQMKVTVEEYGNDSSRLRTVVIDNIPLKVGVSYTQTVEKGCLDDADYSLLSSEGNRINVTSDTIDLHQHLFENEFELIQNANCVDYGFSCSLCTICNKWCREITEATGHNYVKEVEISATCTEAGYSSFTCSLCKDVYSEDINAIGHNDENNDNFCDACNEIVYKNCECPCHSDNWFVQFLAELLYAITEFLGVEKYHYCDCGISHW